MSVLVESHTVITARQSLPICVVDDDADLVELKAGRLEKAGFPVTGTTAPQEALQRVRMGACRVVLADLKMPTMDGLTFLDKTLEYDPGTYVILITGYYSVDSAIEAIRRGAYDFLCKPVNFLRLEKALDDLAAVFSQRSKCEGWRRNCFRTYSLKGLWGTARRCWKCSICAGRWRDTTPMSW
jgi:DNA-binding NtrC family response regulator